MDLVTPSGGGNVKTTDRMGGDGLASGNYRNDFGGTSAACPQVSGTAALMLSANPQLSESQVRSILQETATDMGAAGFDNTFGYGRLNAGKAVMEAKERGAYISGNSTLCTSSKVYSLGNYPTEGDLDVTWSATPSHLFTSTSGSGSTFSTAWDGSGSGSGTITAKLSGDCGSVDVEKEVWLGSPDFSLSGESQIYTYGSSTVLVNWSSSGINYEGQGSPTMNWSYTGPLFDVKGDYRKASLMAGGRSGYGWVYGEATNQCGSNTEDFAYEVIEDSPYSLSVSPVPADDQMTVTIY